MVYMYLGMAIKTLLIIGFALLLKYNGETKSIEFASRSKFYGGVGLLLVAILFNLGATAHFGWNEIAQSNIEVAAIFTSVVIYFTGLGFIAAGLFYNKHKKATFTGEAQN